MGNRTPTIEESIEELKKNCADVCTSAQIEKELLRRKPSMLLAATSIGAMQFLIGKMLRAIIALADENKVLREDAMQAREVKRTVAGMRFDRVSKAELN